MHAAKELAEALVDIRPSAIFDTLVRLHISRIDQFSEKDRTGGRSLDTLIVIMNDGEHLWPVCDSVCDFCNF